MTGVVQDVTERVRAADALRDSEQRLKAVFNQAAVGIAVAELDGRFSQVNQRFCDILGYSAEELMKLTFRDLTYLADLPETESKVGRLLAGEISDYALEKRYIRKDRSLVWSFTSVTLLKDRDGRPVRFVGVIEDITPRKEGELALKRSEEYNRNIIASSQDCIKTLSLNGDLLWISDVGKKVLCITDDSQIVGKSYIELWEGENKTAAADAIATARAGKPSSFVGLLEANGRKRWWDVVVSPILGAGTDPEQLLVVSREITDRKRAEEQLRVLADSIPQLAWMADPSGNIFWYNRQWYEYTGTTLEEMQGWGWQSVHDPKILPHVVERWKESLRCGTPFEMEFPLRGKDGVLRWFLTRVNPLKDEQGQVTRWFGTNTNIDQLKRTREALQEETRVLELLNDTGKAIASKLDLQTLVQTVTDAGTTLSGAKFGAFFYTVVNERGESFVLYSLAGAPREAFDKFGMPRNTPLFGPTFRGEGVVRSADILKDPRYGKMAPHHGLPPGHLPVRSYLAVPVVSRIGEVIGGLFFGHPEPNIFTERVERLIVGIAAQAATGIDNARLFEAAQKEIAERKRAEEVIKSAKEEAERANRAKDEFLAIVSHELRTPLTSMLGWARMLKAGGLDAAQAAHGISVIERNVSVQTQLIEDLLDVSRIITGKLSLTIGSVDLMKTIHAAVESIKPAADAKQLNVSILNDSSINIIAGDSGRLQQVFWNLLSNAVKFTPRGGNVSVRVTQVSSTLRVSVTDSGTGIRPEFLRHIFQRFRQDDSSTTRSFGGLGLGLAIVRHLVEQHGGTIRAESEGQNRGATFTVELPVRAIAPSSATLSAVPDVHGVVKPLTGQHILVVDDEADSRDLVAIVLQSAGAVVSTAGSVDEALQVFDQNPPDIIVSDIGMPLKDGNEFIRLVRSRSIRTGGRVSALALTAYAREEDRVRALRAGFDAHASKPIDPKDLIQRVLRLRRD